MDIQVPYGKENVLNASLPDNNVLGVIHPNEVEKQNEKDILLKAVENPINCKSLSDFLDKSQNVLFIVNDGTRPTPTKKILDIIYDQIKNTDLKFIIATGVHRAPTQEEFDFIFGKYYQIFKDRIFSHDSKKDEDMTYIGTSKNGTEMHVNRMGMEAQKIVIIGSVEPHYFGGYTGGRKSFLPGIASRTTITQNHKHALKPEAQPLVLDGNPVHEDMIDALKTIANKEIFSIQTVLDGERRLYGVTSGHIHDSFYAAIDRAKEVFCVKIPEKADIVVSVAPYPMDIDLYQSQKALDNGKLALKENGILIMVSKCRTGIGEPTFFELLSSCDSPQKTLETIDKGFKLGYHKAAKMAEIGTWAEMWGVTDLEDKDMSSIFIKPFHSLQKALDEALKKKGQKAKVLFLMDGSITVPML